MGLDVILYEKEKIKKKCPYCDSEYEHNETVYDTSITHNLNTMADKAGIYKHLWRPEELNIDTAKDLIEPLRLALIDLKNKPEYYKTFNSPNGFGVYEHFILFVENYLKACVEYPESKIEASR